MSEMDVLLPHEGLNCVVSQNISQQTTDDDERNGAPSGDEIISENGKHLDECEFVVKHGDCNVGDGVLDLNSSERKRKHRRGKKRKWRPYCKLSWDERREVDERDARRANRVRAEMCAYGHTLAPYNTTQFLMEDHNLKEPDYHVHINGHRHRENSSDPSEEFYSSPEDEEEFLQKQFTETYENIHAERLSNMSQAELVQELLNMEDRVEMLQKRLEAAKEERESAKLVDSEVQTPDFLEERVVKLTVFREEIRKLTQENEILRRENEYLRTQLPVEDEDDDEDIL